MVSRSTMTTHLKRTGELLSLILRPQERPRKEHATRGTTRVALRQCQEPCLHEQRKLVGCRSFKRENHYRLKPDAEPPPEFRDLARALGQFGTGMRNYAVIDVPVEPMPNETGREFLHRFDITATGVGMARRPREVRTRSRTEIVNVAEQIACAWGHATATAVERNLQRAGRPAISLTGRLKGV